MLTIDTSYLVPPLDDARAAAAAPASLPAFRARLSAARDAFVAASGAMPWGEMKDPTLALYDSSLLALERVLQADAPFRGPAADQFLAEYERLQQAALTCFGRASLEGPSAYPVANALMHATRAVRAGHISREDFGRIVSAARMEFEAGAASVRQAQGEPAEAIVAMDAALRQCAEVLTRLERAEPSAMDGCLEDFEAAQAALADAMLLHRKLKMESGPTSSPVVNVFVMAADGVKTGAFPAAMFEQNLDGLANHVAQMQRELEQARSSASLEAAVPLLEATVANHAQALAEYRRYFSENDPGALDAANALLIEAAAWQEQARQALSVGGDLSLCPRCGGLCEGGAPVCKSCAQPLPGNPECDLPMTDHVRRVVDDVNRVLNGAISVEDFEATLGWMDSVAVSTQAQLRNAGSIDPAAFVEPDEQEQAIMVSGLVEETKQMLADAIGAVRASLGQMRGYVAGRDPQHLSVGLRMFWSACKDVRQAEQVARMSAARLAPTQLEVAPMPVDDDETPVDVRDC
ncbi:MAG: hypothetical protein FJX76_09200 [Armatimonadetes bacterium]|nr:hypothetical protein [Armatimonadota bacterium]